MTEKRNERSAYTQIVNLCYKYGIISAPQMTEAELRVVLDSLCAALVTPRAHERAALERQHSEQDTQR